MTKKKVFTDKATAKPKEPKKSRTLMYVQKVSYLKSRFPDDDALKKHLEATFPDDEWAFITHDKDVEAGVKLDDHVHVSFAFKSPRSPLSIAKSMLEPATLQKDGTMAVSSQSVQIFSGPTAKQSVFSYLIHATPTAVEEGKHRYGVTEVTANFDFRAYVGRSTMAARARALDIEDIRARIISGDVIMKDFFVDGKLGTKEELGLFYSTHFSKIDKATDTRYKILMKSNEVEELEIIYIQGPSGSGKTTLAKEYAMRKYHDYFMSGSSNDSTQDYMGEPVAIFDDARPGDFNASDWLKLLDPFNNKSTVTSRYYNKYLAVKCIIITTTTPFNEFFLHAKQKGDVKEPVDQFMRRFNLVLKVHAETDDEKNQVSVGRVFEVVKCAPFELPDFKDEDGKPVVMSYTLEEVPGGQIRVTTPERRNIDKAQDLLRYFEE